MTSADEDWVKAAMTDDTMVVELLVRLHHAPPPPSRPIKPPAFPLEWSVRQRRSKPVSVTNSSKKPATRASPTTPLSWSVATSFSGGCAGGGGGATYLDGGFEESSRPSNLSNCTRSKVNGDSEKTASKRSRKKKVQTLAELKEEENLLVKERRELKRDIAALRINLEKQRAKNESLKRMKIELQPLPDRGTTPVREETISGQLQQTKTAFHYIPPMVPPIISGNDVILQSSTLKQRAVTTSDPKFVLPDLNMPLEEETVHDITCGVS